MVSNTKPLEQQLLLQHALRLENSFNTSDSFEMLQAMSECRLLWLTLRSMLEDPEHPYPAELRNQLIFVASIVIQELNRTPEQCDVPFVLQAMQQIASGLSEIEYIETLLT